jgi:serine/threonine protein kinase
MRAIYVRGQNHFALRPDNIFLGADWHPRIGGIGSGTLDHPTGAAPDCPLGSLIYLAPEIISGQPRDESADVFSFALVVYEMVTGHKVFGSAKTIQELTKLHEGGRPNFPDIIEPNAAFQLQRCWAFDPDQRPLFDDILAGLLDIGLLLIQHQDVDGGVVANYCGSIIIWEKENVGEVH